MGFLILVSSGVIGSGLWMNGKFESVQQNASDELRVLNQQLAEMKDQIKDLSFKIERIDDKNTYIWTLSQMEAFALKMARDNTSLKVPEVK
jgi:TolA-binding protein